MRDAAVTESGRFGPEVPVQTIEVTDPAIETIPQAEREVIGEKVSYRLAQQPGSYVVLKYVRKVVKRRDTKAILTAPAPANVLERSAADVSFLAAMLVDKFCWHLPLYRQHQRLLDAGITLSRSTLVYWASRAIDLLAPITDARVRMCLRAKYWRWTRPRSRPGARRRARCAPGGVASVRRFRRGGVPLRAIARTPSRSCLSRRGTLLSDGYDGYSAYAAQRLGEVIHALCWSHTRRTFERANDSEPEAVAEALALIGAMYAHEKQIRADALTGQDKRAYRIAVGTPVTRRPPHRSVQAR